MAYTFKRGTPFWEKVAVAGPDECWPWLAGRGSHGYGNSYTPRGLAHRIAYEDRLGPIPSGLTIDHLCKNRLCCNPAHMEIVTRSENSRRGEQNRTSKSGRARPDLTQRDGCVNGHEFSGNNFYWRGNARICRACAAERIRRFRERQAAARVSSTLGGDG